MIVSVIIPVFQGKTIIRGAVLSALHQTVSDIEIIVVDDGSTDETLNVLRSIEDSRIIVLQQPNSGTAAARNHGLRIARGNYIAFLDSDDRWFPTHLERCISALGRSDRCPAIAYSGYFAVDNRGRLLNPARLVQVEGSILQRLIDGENFLYPSVCVYDRTVFDVVGLFTDDCYHEDYEYVLRAAALCHVVATGERLVVYRQSSDGKCRSILANFSAALNAELDVSRRLEHKLTYDQIRRLKNNAYRSLYYRFLMYGFEQHARSIGVHVKMSKLRGGKGLLALLFAATRINLLAPARQAVQSANLLFRQRHWSRKLSASGLSLEYGVGATPGD